MPGESNLAECIAQLLLSLWQSKTLWWIDTHRRRILKTGNDSDRFKPLSKLFQTKKQEGEKIPDSPSQLRHTAASWAAHCSMEITTDSR